MQPTSWKNVAYTKDLDRYAATKDVECAIISKSKYLSTE